MSKLTCIIIEDEPLAAEILQNYITQVHFIELKGVATDALFALELLQQQNVDVIFLDINLPRMKGLDFIRTLKQPPHIILTTAYRDYGVESYELNVADYLLKPIEFSRFLTAVNKLPVNQQQQVNNSPANPAAAPPQHIFINHQKKKVKINLADITYIESRREYINIITTQQSYLVKQPLSEIEIALPAALFTRIHKSFIIAINAVTAYNATEIEIRNHPNPLPIGRNYKEGLLKIMNKLARK